MKKPKSKNKSAITPAVKSVGGQMVPYDPPTTERIAMIAAILAHRFGADCESNETNLALKRWHRPWQNIVGHAFSIWGEVNIQMEDLGMFATSPQTRAKIFTFRDGDHDGYISRETFLKRLLPKSKTHRTYDIGRIGRAFIRYLYLEDCKILFHKLPDDKEFEAYYGGWKVPERDANRLCIRFRRWYQKFVIESRRVGGKASAAARTDKPEADAQIAEIENLLKKVEKKALR